MPIGQTNPASAGLLLIRRTYLLQELDLIHGIPGAQRVTVQALTRVVSMLLHRIGKRMFLVSPWGCLTAIRKAMFHQDRQLAA